MAITKEELGVGGFYCDDHHDHLRKLVLHVSNQHVIYESSDLNHPSHPIAEYVWPKDLFIKNTKLIKLPPIAKGKTCQQVYEEIEMEAGELSPNAWFTCGWCEGQSEGAK